MRKCIFLCHVSNSWKFRFSHFSLNIWASVRRLCSCRLCVFRCLSVSALDYRTHRGAPSHWFGMRVVFFLQTFNPLRLINISFWSLQSLSALNCKNKTQTGERNLIISMKTQLQQQRQKSLTLRTCRTRTAFRKQWSEIIVWQKQTKYQEKVTTRCFIDQRFLLFVTTPWNWNGGCHKETHDVTETCKIESTVPK